MAKFPKTILVDTGYWFALYNPRDQYHTQAASKENLLRNMNLLIPWPCLYETMNSRFVRDKNTIRNFETLLKLEQVEILSDESYRELALQATLSWARRSERNISLVDMVIRLILDDVNVKKHGLLTFNNKDFIDICTKHRIEMV